MTMKAYKLKGYSTWNDVMKNKKITDIQDPILEMEIDKCEFEIMYKEIVCELQGNDDVFESYIEKRGFLLKKKRKIETE